MPAKHFRACISYRRRAQKFTPRQVSARDLRLLIADYTVTCYDEGGGVNAEYLPLLVGGVFLTFVWVLGVPLYFGVQLYRHRAIIQVNRSN